MPKVRGTNNGLYQKPTGISGAASLDEKLGVRPAADSDTVSIAHLLTGFKGKNETLLDDLQCLQNFAPHLLVSRQGLVRR